MLNCDGRQPQSGIGPWVLLGRGSQGRLEATRTGRVWEGASSKAVAGTEARGSRGPPWMVDDHRGTDLSHRREAGTREAVTVAAESAAAWTRCDPGTGKPASGSTRHTREGLGTERGRCC